MYSKALTALAAASLASQAMAVAVGAHQHGHQHLHDKRAIVTQVTTVTDWVTVTVTEGETAPTEQAFYTNAGRPKQRPSSSTSSSSSSSVSVAAPVVEVPSTTIITQVQQTTAVPETSTPPANDATTEVVSTPPAVVAPSSTEAPQASQAPANGGSSGSGETGGPKRGLAYNDPQLLKAFINTGTKVSWTYNWGQYDDSGVDLEFCPMLWGLKLDFAQTWPANAQKAIDAGSKCLFSFNEPDLGAQANLSPQVAATKHIELMNPFSGKALIGAPAITNSGDPNQGVGWLKQWFDACGGKCAVDFVNIHIYGVDTNTFLSHVRNVYATFQKPVWITEFAFDGSDDQINSQLATVIDQIENNSTYSFVQRYSYFMVQQGTMVKGNSLSTYGNTFAYGA
ncbi:glycoside hydrolase family 128 protein [Canariomyces notabilis]|uniref:Glycoside hydrolase family 128 protein n=1 Tax=Canariomyces notabilis TaxID=2074819 RepID=A0AAN6TJB9_9PEZI|nr:glycoside hydrolase family 128 protein [Canariomyces arenarius]